jgi:hypothetical protein
LICLDFGLVLGYLRCVYVVLFVVG